MEFFISQLAVDNEQFQYITIKSVRAILAQGVSANCTLRNTSFTVRKKLLLKFQPLSVCGKDTCKVFRREYSTEVPPSDSILAVESTDLLAWGMRFEYS